MFAYLILLTGCQKREIRHNDANDIEEATVFATEYYARIGRHDFEEASKLFGGEVKPSAGLDFLKNLNILHGNLLNANISLIETNVKIIDDLVSKEYVIDVIAEYEKKESKETITIQSIHDTLKISGYRSNMQ